MATKLEEFGLWMKAVPMGDRSAIAVCEKAGLSLEKELEEGFNGAGAFLVPVQHSTGIISHRQSAGFLRKRATVRPMTSDLQQVPVGGGDVVAGFTPESLAIKESEEQFRSIGLSTSKLSVRVTVSSEALENAETLGSYLAKAFGDKFGELEDTAGIAGNGSPAFGKILGFAHLLATGAYAGGIVATSGHNDLTELDASELEKLPGAVPGQYHPNSRWICSAAAQPKVFGRLGAEVYGSVETADGPRPLMSYMGYPIEVVQGMPAGGDLTGKVAVAFGDVRAAVVMGERRSISVKASTHRLFDQDAVMFRATERIAISSYNLGNSSEIGALAGLIGA